jgi:hypothetical protein
MILKIALNKNKLKKKLNETYILLLFENNDYLRINKGHIIGKGI